MPSYVKRHWNETRGDKYDAWGTSWWYFEVDDDGWVIRQIEQYDSGMLLCYSVEHEDDEFGGLAEKTLDLSEAEFSAISAEEFESIWRGL
jgi:hypothetical protein